MLLESFPKVQMKAKSETGRLAEKLLGWRVEEMGHQDRWEEFSESFLDLSDLGS